MFSFCVDSCFPLQMEVNVMKKRHRTRSKGVRGMSLLAKSVLITIVNTSELLKRSSEGSLGAECYLARHAK